MILTTLNYIVLSLYLWALFITGRKIISESVCTFPLVLIFVCEGIVGMAVGVPITYFLSMLFAWTGEPVFWGVIVYVILIFATLFKSRQVAIIKRISIHDLGIVLFSIAISTWLMNKTFHGVGDLVFVGSNTVFDFGHALGLIRSMS